MDFSQDKLCVRTADVRRFNVNRKDSALRNTYERIEVRISFG